MKIGILVKNLRFYFWLLGNRLIMLSKVVINGCKSRYLSGNNTEKNVSILILFLNLANLVQIRFAYSLL